MPSKPPSLLSAFLSDKAPGYASKIAHASDDEPSDASDDKPDADDTSPTGVNAQAAQAVLDALDSGNAVDLATALESVIDLHTHQEPKAAAKDTPSKPALVIHVHAHGA
jgi:hypothetical protein